jgi:hypothetical protein
MELAKWFDKLYTLIGGESSFLYLPGIEPYQAAKGVLRLGGDGTINYVEIQDDGTIRLYGEATTWYDLTTQLIGRRLESPSSKITQNNAEGSLTFANNTTLSDYVTMSPQLIHGWKIGSKPQPHFHWWQISSDVPNWMLQYRWQNNGSLKESSWTSLAYDNHAFTYVSGTLNQITGFPDITPPDEHGLSDVLQIRFLRDTGNASGLFAGADPSNTDEDAFSFDIHVEKDSLGSNEPFIK